MLVWVGTLVSGVSHLVVLVLEVLEFEQEGSISKPFVKFRVWSNFDGLVVQPSPGFGVLLDLGVRVKESELITESVRVCRRILANFLRFWQEWNFGLIVVVLEELRLLQDPQGKALGECERRVLY